MKRALERADPLFFSSSYSQDLALLSSKTNLLKITVDENFLDLHRKLLHSPPSLIHEYI